MVQGVRTWRDVKKKPKEPELTPAGLADVARWLDTVRCTIPFALEDAAELKGLIKGMTPAARVEVYWLRGPAIVHVRVRLGDGELVRDLVPS